MNESVEKKVEGKLSFIEKIKYIYEKLGILLTIIGTISIFIFYNPSGYSYYHWLITLDWILDTEHVIYVFGGFLLLLPVFLDLPSAWRAAGFKGKAIFFIALIFTGFIFYTENLYEEVINIIWATETSIVAFMLWGGYVNFRDRKKFSVYGTEEQGTQEVDIND